MPYDLELLIRDWSSSTISLLTYAFWSHRIAGVRSDTTVTVIGETVVLNDGRKGSACSYV